MRKYLILALCAMLLMSCFAVAESDLLASAANDPNFNAEGYPLVKETVKKTIMIRKPGNIGAVEDMETLKYIAKLMNLEIEWIVVSADGWNERVNLVLASNDMPDIIMKGGIPNFARVIESGKLYALDDLMDKYSVGIKPLLEQYPGVDAAARASDGKLYGLPGVNTLKANLTGHRNLWINKQWLDNLSLEVPTTVDELIDVMRAFRDNDADGDGDPNNEIPYGVEDAGAGHTTKPEIAASMFGIYSNLGYGNVMLRDGVVSFMKTDDVWKQVLEFLHLLYDEKLMDNEVFTHTGDMSIGKISNGSVGVFGLSSDDLFTTVADQYIALAPPVSDSGWEPVIALASNSRGRASFIPTADESPWVSFRLLDYFYTYEGSMTIGCFNDDLIGITCQKLEDGRWEYAEHMMNDPRGVAVAVGDACPLPGGGFGYWRQEDNSNYIYSAKVQENVPLWEPYYQKDPVYGSPQFESAVADRLTEIKSDLDVYVAECQAKFITGELSFDKWDEYVETTVSLYADELVEYYQDYIDSLG